MNEAKYSITKKDLELTWFHGSGAGGQHRNKHANCCRIRHPETGVITTGQSHKERTANQKEALTALAKHYKIRHFLEQKLNEIETGITIEQAAQAIVDDLMQEENFKEVSDKDFRLLTKGKTREVINGVEVWS